MTKHFLLYIEWTKFLWKKGIILWSWSKLYHEMGGGKGEGEVRGGEEEKKEEEEQKGN